MREETVELGQRWEESDSYPMGGQVGSHPTWF